MKIIGTKYQTYINDELVILRLFSVKDGEYILLDDNNKKIKFNSEEELNKLVALTPDAVMNIMSTSTNDNHKDIFICLQKSDTILNSNPSEIIPDLILRQDIYSYTKNWSGDNQIYVGDCIIKETAPSKQDYINLMSFDKILDSDTMALYIDDTMNEIKLLLDQKRFRKYNFTLLEIWNKCHMNAVGYCKDLIELMNSNSFITNFRMMFNILQLDFPIKLANNFTDDGIITLNKKQINRLQLYLQKYITDISVLEYDKDIDISKIVRNTHTVVSDSNGKIFIINYKVVGDLVQEDTSDVVAAMSKLLNK